ncbi:MAG: NUDIX domain-containing protein [Bacteroidetes bacterium]|nr:NUDIX domain-containing protein [Bacteroidota bacterium]
MSQPISAGLLMYRVRERQLEVFLAHPGGPYFKNREWGVWSVPKGSVEPNEELLETAIREFQEETGLTVHTNELIPLGSVMQRGGKTVHCWAFEGNVSAETPIVSNTFQVEWPPNSGQIQVYPETDKARFFHCEMAKKKLNPAQAHFVERLHAHLRTRNRI